MKVRHHVLASGNGHHVNHYHHGHNGGPYVLHRVSLAAAFAAPPELYLPSTGPLRFERPRSDRVRPGAGRYTGRAKRRFVLGAMICS